MRRKQNLLSAGLIVRDVGGQNHSFNLFLTKISGGFIYMCNLVHGSNDKVHNVKVMLNLSRFGLKGGDALQGSFRIGCI